MNNAEPIGKQLQKARDALSLALHDVEAILKIKAPVIQMLENDAYPSQNIDVFVKGQLISYCKLLNINAQTIINCLEAKGYDFPLGQQPPQNTHSKPSNKSSKRILFIMICSLIMICMLISIVSSSSTSAPSKPSFTQPIKLEPHYDN